MLNRKAIGVLLWASLFQITGAAPAHAGRMQQQGSTRAASPTPGPTWPQVQVEWTAVGSKPRSDAAAAALVIHQPEQRTGNAAANAYVPSDAELAAFRAEMPTFLNDQLRQYVTGRPGLSNPSTDDLIQWVSAKWGIPTDWIRAQAVQESHWTQPPVSYGYGLGDKATVTPAQYALYPPAAQLGNNAVYQSMGIMQCKWLGGVATGVNAGTEPLRWKSTAFNLDYYAHYIRWLYDGYTVNISWIPNIYRGQPWNAIGGWYGGNVAGQERYIQLVKERLAGRSWTRPGF